MGRKFTNALREERNLRRKMAKIQRRKLFKKPSFLTYSKPIKVSGQVCAICGEREATTKDHVPPKAIFPKPRPSNLITVPACHECNNGASDNDDLFKVYLSMHAADNNEIAKQLFQDKTYRTLKRNQNLLGKIRRESKKLNIVSDRGSIETRTGVLWDSDAHDAVIERIIRGLYFHHVGHPVPKDSDLSVQWLSKIPDELLPKLHLFNEVRIGNEQFIYKYVVYPEDPRHSIWLFEFYGAHWASGVTVPSSP